MLVLLAFSENQRYAVRKHYYGDCVKFGFWQIVLILAIACGILLVTRSTERSKANTKSRRVRMRHLSEEELEELRIREVRQKRLRWLGIAIIVVGLAALCYILSTIIDSVIIFSAIAGFVILAGIVVIVFSIRR